MIRKLFHALAAGYNIYVLNWLRTHQYLNETIEDDAVRELASLSPRFLTIWTFALCTIYFITCVIIDLPQKFSIQEYYKKYVRNIMSYIFTQIITPTTTLVNVIFWLLYFINPDLIIAKQINDRLPTWINCSLHFYTSITVFIEMLFYFHSFRTLRQALPVITVYYLIYLACLR
ncbi:androgen-dependent TFPI-regulating protein-like isoform X2 [Lycorma delicatula]|uniref:androgen-dependent TFPI-regulating protein-like isoform X2 n=1 Tax=Lycorma delicatula TaxID=130591 RepID=UPI003F515999